MYFDELLWQKKRRIQKERWYQRERNKEISVLKKIQESIPYSRGDEARTWCVNGSSQCPASFIKKRRKKWCNDDVRNRTAATLIQSYWWWLLAKKNSKGFKKRLRNCPFNLLVIRGQIILKREGMIWSKQGQIRILM